MLEENNKKNVCSSVTLTDIQYCNLGANFTFIGEENIQSESGGTRVSRFDHLRKGKSAIDLLKVSLMLTLSLGGPVPFVTKAKAEGTSGSATVVSAVSGPIDNQDDAVDRAKRLPFVPPGAVLNQASSWNSPTGLVWNLAFTESNPNSDGLSSSVNLGLAAADGSIQQLSVSSSITPKTIASNGDSQAVGQDKAATIAKSFIDGLHWGLDAEWKPNPYPESAYSTRSDDKSLHKVRFERSVNGIPDDQERFVVYVDQSGNVVSYQMNWSAIKFDDPSGVISLDKAKGIMFDHTVPVLQYTKSGTIGPRLEYFLPQQTMDAATGTFPAQNNYNPHPNSGNLKAISDEALELLTNTANLSEQQMLDRIDRALNLSGKYEVRQADSANGVFDLVIPTEDPDRFRFDHMIFNVNTGQMAGYSTGDGTDYSWITKPNLDEEAARRNAIDFLCEVMPAYANQLTENHVELIIGSEGVQVTPQYRFHFDRIANGIAVDGEDVEVGISAATGKVNGALSHLTETDYQSQPAPAISQEQAKRMLLSLYDVELQYGWKSVSEASLYYRLMLKPDVPRFYTGAAPYIDAVSGNWIDMIGNPVSVPKPEPGTNTWIDDLISSPDRIQYQAGIVLDGHPLASGNEPIIRNGITLVPFRGLLEKLNAIVGWDAEHQRVTAEKGTDRIELIIDKNTAFVNGKEIALEVPAQLVNSSTYVPVRFVAEMFGAKVDWEGESRLVLIRSDGLSQQPSEEQLKQWRLETELNWEAKQHS